MKVIGIIIGIILLIGGIVVGAAGITVILDELVIINKTIAAGIYATIFGLVIFVIGKYLIDLIIKD